MTNLPDVCARTSVWVAASMQCTATLYFIILFINVVDGAVTVVDYLFTTTSSTTLKKLNWQSYSKQSAFVISHLIWCSTCSKYMFSDFLILDWQYIKYNGSTSYFFYTHTSTMPPAGVLSAFVNHSDNTVKALFQTLHDQQL